MRLRAGRPTVGPSPDRDGHVRVSAACRLGPGEPRRLWFDVPDAHADEVASGPEPWLLLLLPLAASTGRDLVLSGAADPELVANAGELLRIWDRWYPWTDRVGIHVATADGTRGRTGERTAAFFSGGVDSFYTLLRHEAESPPADGRESIDDLVTVCGFDIPVRRTGACRRVFAATGEVAGALGKHAVTVFTNVRATSWEESVPWEKLGFGPALAACGHLLPSRYGRILFPAGSGYARMSPRGCHPLTAPLMGSGSLIAVHDGAAASRVEKTRRVAESRLARRHLRVCWRSGTDRNCSRCEKCYRTMLTLHLLDRLSDFGSFREELLRLDLVPRVLARKESDAIFLREIEQLARDSGDEEAARRVRQALRRSWLKRRLLRLGDLLSSVRWLGWVGRWLRRTVLGRSIV